MAGFVKPLDEHVTVRNLRLMPILSDITLVILKGHLLIEEMLKRILQQDVNDPSCSGRCTLIVLPSVAASTRRFLNSFMPIVGLMWTVC